MTTRVGFLRAVNVGRRRVEMARLAEVCRRLGYGDVWTYINSGNVVFSAAGRATVLEGEMETALADEFGFEVTTFVRTPSELHAVLAVEPFPISDGDTYFVTFLKAPPAATVARQLEAASNDFDTLVVHGREVHWRMRGSSMETQVKKSTWNVLGEFGSTSRNVTMLRKLVAKLDG